MRFGDLGIRLGGRGGLGPLGGFRHPLFFEADLLVEGVPELVGRALELSQALAE
jgi:hypothetical protein